MIGMVYKDFLVMRKQLGYYLIFFAVYAVLSVLGVFPPTILPAMLVVVGMMLPMSSIAYDDQARWDKYAASTTAGRHGIIAGKYLFALLCILGCAVAVAVFQGGLALAGLLTLDLMEQAFVILACGGVALFLNSIILPLLIKFGAEKSRTISMIVFVGIFGGGMLLLQVMEKGGTLPTPPAWLISALPIVLALVVVGAYVISYFIAVGIMEKKEL